MLSFALLSNKNKVRPNRALRQQVKHEKVEVNRQVTTLSSNFPMVLSLHSVQLTQVMSYSTVLYDNSDRTEHADKRFCIMKGEHNLKGSIPLTPRSIDVSDATAPKQVPCMQILNSIYSIDVKAGPLQRSSTHC